MALPRLVLPSYPVTSELGYAERTSVFTTTNVTLWDLAAKIGSLSVTETGEGLPVFVEFFAPLVKHSVAEKYVAAYLIINGSEASGQLGIVDSPATGTARTLLVRRRMLLTAGTSYTFEVGIAGESAGTSSVDGAANYPMYLAVTR